MRLHRSIPLLRIVPDDTKFDFMRFRRISFPVSAILSIAAIFLYFFHGLNMGIDFVGGTLIEVQSKAGPADLAKMRTTLSGLSLGDVQLQQFGAPTDVLIRVAQQPGGEAAQQAAITKVRQALGDEVNYRRVEVVGPRVSTELLAYSTIGLVLAIFSILIYLWFRFEWQFALGAMVANVHDLVLTVGFMSLTQIDFDLSSIAALLTILGYSLNDTVVIYDRIREMLRRYKKMPMPDLLNVSVNSTLSRSIITHVTVTLALLALLFFGGHAIHSFVATMIFGVVLVGTYTSVFIAAPILIYLGVGVTRGAADEAPEPEPAPTAARSTPARTSARATGWSLTEAGTPHLPYRAAIDRYGKGGFAFAGMSHRASLLCLPNGIWAWPVVAPDDIDETNLAPVFAAASDIGILLLGCGAGPWTMPDALRLRFHALKLNVEVMRTGSAVATYNILHGEGRRVAAGLVAVE